jgi:hypothetical protein
MVVASVRSHAPLVQRRKESTMQRNTRRQGAMTWLWIGLAVVLALVALYVLVGLFG